MAETSRLHQQVTAHVAGGHFDPLYGPFVMHTDISWVMKLARPSMLTHCDSAGRGWGVVARPTFSAAEPFLLAAPTAGDERR